MKNPQFKLSSVRSSDKLLKIQVPIQLAWSESLDFEQSCFDSLDRNCSLRVLILNFEDTQLIDSNGIEALLNIREKVLGRDCKFIFQHAKPEITAQLLSKTDLIIHPSANSLLKRSINLIGAIVDHSYRAIPVIFLSLKLSEF